ncbi:NAD(P)H-dependent flavin oxidoreductase [Thauera sp. Sel9]|uniref:NAD(P)H-dependent flavin oxidoreductase n=1 Tax=Thauera sp. Sel9 TaxID=2974299 RepID=UPI0021E0FCC2|nr:nitronate monooxygenase [Thauera sp. Sel9]MCV2218125.1 nitronate monooxygenase [Thauera sp. Sel9]
MSLPASLHGRFSVPAIAAPMFLVSGPELVIETCKAGVAGTFPALNARPAAQLDEWLTRIDAELAAFRAANPAAPCAPHGVNLILHASNARLKEDLATLVRHRVPIVITSLGNPAEVADVVHGYGGLVLSDVVHAYHARKAIAAGVDGIIAVAGGAGGHAGVQSTISLVREIREFWDGLLVAAGSISDGAAIRAVEVLGADLAYMGTRFIATRESMAQPEYKQMVVESTPADIVYTDAISGANANFMWPSLERAGYRREELAAGFGKGKLHDLSEEAKAWRDVWSAGHGVATIEDVPATAELVARLAAEYCAACALPPSAALAPA